MTNPAKERRIAAGHGDAGIRYEKIAISLPSRAAESVRRAVKYGRSPSVSAYIASAIEEKTSRESLIEMLEDMLEESGGPATPAEKRWVDWHLAPKRRGKRPPWPTSFDSKPRQRRGR